MKSRTLLIATLLVLLAVAAHANVPLKRTPHRFIPNTERHLYSSLLANGDSIPMEGGLLVIGTYVATLAVGTPAVNFNLIIDTGSSNTAVPVVGCSTCGTTSPFYNPTASSTFTQMGCGSSACATCTPSSTQCSDCSLFYGPGGSCSPNTPAACGFGITYGGGSSSLQGYYGYEHVCFGNLCANITLSVIENEYPSASFITPDSNGILGLASEANACNPTCVPTILDSLVSAGQTSNFFSMCITGTGGVLDIGLIDTAKYTGSITYVPMSFDRWYNIELIDIQIGSHSIGLPPFLYTTTNDVIGTFVDSGTSLLLMNPVSYEYFSNTFLQYYSSLPGVSKSGFFSSSTCVPKGTITNINAYPNITFVFEGYNNEKVYLPVPASAYLIPYELFYCFGVASVPGVGVVLGDVFMENYYVVFDRTNLQLGFAPVVASNCKV